MSEVDIYKEISKKTPKEQFNWFWRNSTKESILNQFYYEHNDLITANKLITQIEEYIKENKTKNGDLESFDVKVILHLIEEYQDE